MSTSPAWTGTTPPTSPKPSPSAGVVWWLTDQITEVAALVFRLATEFDAAMTGPDAGGDEVYAVTRQTVGLTTVTDLAHDLAERLTVAADGGWGTGAKPAWLDGGEGK